MPLTTRSTPEAIRALPPAVHDIVIQAFSSAMRTGFRRPNA
jgi:hypothetical protein